MGIKEQPTKVFLDYLKYLGLVKIPLTKGGSHSKYNYPADHPNGQLSRPVIVRENYPTIPVLHLHTNLTTIDPVYGKKNFEKWLADGQPKK